MFFAISYNYNDLRETNISLNTRVHYPGRISWDLEMSILVEGRKPENPEKKPQNKARINNKVNPTYGTGSESWERWTTSAFHKL